MSAFRSNRVARAINSALPEQLELRRLGSQVGQTHGGDRDTYETFGYPADPGYTDFYNLYRRNGLAGAIVDKPIKATWAERPMITDSPDEASPFEDAVDWLFDELGLLHYFERVDTLNALGRYALLYLGVQDGVAARDLDQPVDDTQISELDPTGTYTAEQPAPISHLSVFGMGSISDPKLGSDPTHPRYNMPLTYPIDFGADAPGYQDTHWSRVIHVASGLLESDWDGTPLLERPYNRLVDWDKTVGGSAEANYQNADRKLIFDLDSDIGKITDESELEDQIEALVHDIRPYMQTQGMDVTSIGADTTDPSGLAGVIKEEIAGQGSVPQRILTGSERGDLASSQDEANFDKAISQRQQRYAEPTVVRPFIDRLIAWGILPTPEGGTYQVDWPDQFSLTELETAEAMQTRADALGTAAPMGDPGAFLTDGEIIQFVVDGPDEELVEAVVERSADLDPDRLDELPDEDMPDEDIDAGMAWWSERYGT